MKGAKELPANILSGENRMLLASYFRGSASTFTKTGAEGWLAMSRSLMAVAVRVWSPLVRALSSLTRNTPLALVRVVVLI